MTPCAECPNCRKRRVFPLASIAGCPACRVKHSSHDVRTVTRAFASAVGPAGAALGAPLSRADLQRLRADSSVRARVAFLPGEPGGRPNRCVAPPGLRLACNGVGVPLAPADLARGWADLPADLLSDPLTRLSVSTAPDEGPLPPTVVVFAVVGLRDPHRIPGVPLDKYTRLMVSNMRPGGRRTAMSLLCPISGRRILRAARFSHLPRGVGGAFDLEAALEAGARGPWTCPHSGAPASPQHLVADPYLDAILLTLAMEGDQATLSVELDPRAWWRPVGSTGPFREPREWDPCSLLLLNEVEEMEGLLALAASLSA